MRNCVAVLAVVMMLSAATASAQLVTNGVWTPISAAGNDGSTPFSNPSWDEPIGVYNLSYQLGNGVEWLRDPNTGGLARWTWKGWTNQTLTDLGGTSEFLALHYMEYAGDAIGMTAGVTNHVAWSAPPDGGPNTSMVLVRFKVPGTLTVNYALFIEDLPDGPVGPIGWAPRDGDFNDRGILWVAEPTCEEIRAAYLKLLAVR
jgi:hypothetical protein